MYKRNQTSISLLPKLLLCATLVLGISACSDDDEMESSSDTGTGQETVNADGS